jgi:hypothetical protein
MGIKSASLTKLSGSISTSDLSKNSSATSVYPLSVEYLIVGAGGGGRGGTGCCVGGSGGGAGGYLSGIQKLIPGRSYNFVVGTGVYEENGGYTTAVGLTAFGGGRGYGYSGRNGSMGASGGGGPWEGSGSTSGYSGFLGQGFDGGDNLIAGQQLGIGGGGGASQEGSPGSTPNYDNAGGPGGNGRNSLITGQKNWYAGGGGSGIRNNYGSNYTGMVGGYGGGGKGSDRQTSNPANGEANTGGGGGGGFGNNGGAGSTGGSGVIVIAYPNTYSDINSIGAGLTYTLDTITRPGYKVYRFTAGSGAVKFDNLTEEARPYNTSSLFFDFDAADLTYNDGAVIPTTVPITKRDDSSTMMYAGGTLTYRSANGGHLDFGSAAGYARVFNMNSTAWSVLNSATSMSVVCWFQSDRTSRQVLLSRFYNADSIYDNLVQLNHLVDPTGDYHHNSSGVISGAAGDLNTNSWSANTWTLSVWTYSVSDGIARWYENNANQVATVTYGTDGGAGLSTTSLNTPIGIGVRSDLYPEILKGKMAIARVYTKALSVLEIQQEYAAYKTRFGLS